VAAAQWQPGTIIAHKYQIDGPLAKGGFGETYIATELDLERQCVIKRMLVDPLWSAAEQQTARDNFVREAKLLAKLGTPGHRNIPEIYDYLEAETCLVMKYIQGKNLDELRPRLQAAKALVAMRDICSALVYMHAKQPLVLHRDIKPANILLADDGWVWLIDFGLSKSTPVQNSALSGATMMAGTIGYTPPEQWQSAAVPQSDVYALAATLHTLLTGYVPPFTEPDLPELLSGTKGAFPPVRSLNPAVDQRIERLILRSMAFDIRQRPTAQEFLNEINGLLQPGVAAATIITPTGQAVATPSELAHWCNQHWDEACTWLRDGQLASVIETGFLNAQLAEKIRTIRTKHRHDLNAALDFVIEQLDPAMQRSCAIRVIPHPISFGNLTNDPQPVAKQITLTNVGDRYLALQIRGETWLSATPPGSTNTQAWVKLLPGMQQQVTVYATMANQRGAGQVWTQLQVMSQNGLTKSYSAVATLPRWAKLDRNKIATLLGLLMVVVILYSVVTMANNLQQAESATAVSQQQAQNTPLVPSSATPMPTPSQAEPTPSQAEPTPSAVDTPTAPVLQRARISGVSTLNIRAEPSAASADIGDIYDSTIFELTGEERNGWLSVRVGPTEGWVNGKYVERVP
jgi:serine/threonine protein kinase